LTLAHQLQPGKVYTATACAAVGAVEVAGIGEAVTDGFGAHEVNNKAIIIAGVDIAIILIRIVILYTLAVCS
jgi:hypothetical protein